MQQIFCERIILVIVRKKIDEPSQAQIKAAAVDSKIFGRIYDTYYSPVLNFTYKQCLDFNIAEEVTSDVFFQILKNISRFKYKYPGSFTSWVYKIALNCLRQYGRKQKTKHVNAEADYFLNLPTPESELEEYEQQYDRDNDLKKILTHLKEMAEDDREVISLHFFEQLSNRQIAEITGIKEVSVRSRLSRALAKLHKKLQQS